MNSRGRTLWLILRGVFSSYLDKPRSGGAQAMPQLIAQFVSAVFSSLKSLVELICKATQNYRVYVMKKKGKRIRRFLNISS